MRLVFESSPSYKNAVKKADAIEFFGIRTDLLSQSRPPSDESPEVPFPKNLQIFAIYENFWRRQVKATPSKKGINDTSYWNENQTYSFSSSVLNEILFTLPRKETGSASRMKSAAVPSLNNV